MTIVRSLSRPSRVWPISRQAATDYRMAQSGAASGLDAARERQDGEFPSGLPRRWASCNKGGRMMALLTPKRGKVGGASSPLALSRYLLGVPFRPEQKI